MSTFIAQNAETILLYSGRCVVLLLVIIAARQDWLTFELSLNLTIPAAAIAVFVEGTLGAGWLDAFVGSFAGFVVLKGAQLLARLQHKKECIGSGDAVLMLSLGALVGIKGLPWALGFSVISIFIVAKMLHKQKSEKMPFGPFLVAGSLPVAVIQWSGL